MMLLDNEYRVNPVQVGVRVTAAASARSSAAEWRSFTETWNSSMLWRATSEANSARHSSAVPQITKASTQAF